MSDVTVVKGSWLCVAIINYQLNKIHILFLAQR